MSLKLSIECESWKGRQTAIGLTAVLMKGSNCKIVVCE